MEGLVDRSCVGRGIAESGTLASWLHGSDFAVLCGFIRHVACGFAGSGTDGGFRWEDLRVVAVAVVGQGTPVRPLRWRGPVAVSRVVGILGAGRGVRSSKCRVVFAQGSEFVRRRVVVVGMMVRSWGFTGNGCGVGEGPG